MDSNYIQDLADLLKEIIRFTNTYGKKPDPKSIDPYEKRLAAASKTIKNLL